MKKQQKVKNELTGLTANSWLTVQGMRQERECGHFGGRWYFKCIGGYFLTYIEIHIKAKIPRASTLTTVNPVRCENLLFYTYCVFNLFRRDCSRRRHIGRGFLEKGSFEANCKKWTREGLRGEVPESKTEQLSVWKQLLLFPKSGI